MPSLHVTSTPANEKPIGAGATHAGANANGAGHTPPMFASTQSQVGVDVHAVGSVMHAGCGGNTPAPST